MFLFVFLCIGTLACLFASPVDIEQNCRQVSCVSSSFMLQKFQEAQSFWARSLSYVVLCGSALQCTGMCSPSHPAEGPAEGQNPGVSEVSGILLL